MLSELPGAVKKSELKKVRVFFHVFSWT